MASQYALPRKTSSAGDGGETREHYRKMREPFAAELKDPATRRLLKGIISAENPGAGSAVAESLMNRTAMVNEQRAAKGLPPLSLKSMIQGDASIGGGKSFYGPVRTGAVNQHLARVDADKNYAAQLDSHIDRALSGADTIKGHTDQGSRGDPNYDAGGVGVNINGERFNDWGYGGSREWRERNQALAASGGTGASAIADAAGGPAEGGVPETPTAVASAGGIGSDAARAPNQSDVTDTIAKVESKTKAQDIADAFGDAMSKLGAGYAGGPIAQNARSATGSGLVPMTPQTPAGPIPTFDPRQADAQRQQLAMVLQRLNSGRLF